jgi:Protein of unknown function (DUF2510)
MTDLPAAPAGWYPDGSGQLRWWDGVQWTPYLAPVSQAPAAAAPVSGQVSGFVLGIVSVVFVVIPLLPAVVGFFGWGMSWKALKQLSPGTPGRGLPTTGLVLSIIGSVINVIYSFAALIVATSR